MILIMCPQQPFIPLWKSFHFLVSGLTLTVIVACGGPLVGVTVVDERTADLDLAEEVLQLLRGGPARGQRRCERLAAPGALIRRRHLLRHSFLIGTQAESPCLLRE